MMNRVIAKSQTKCYKFVMEPICVKKKEAKIKWRKNLLVKKIKEKIGDKPSDKDITNQSKKTDDEN